MIVIGETLGHYRILRAAGSGGMGEVYVAEDSELSRSVALKVLKPEVAGSSKNRERFRLEAKTLAALDHPNIVRVYSLEEVDGIHFLTMELVRGQTLSRLVLKEGMNFEEVLRIAICVADALTAAHQEGIIHRDLTPENIMVRSDKEIKVLDFGLAKLVEASAREDPFPVKPPIRLTEPDWILGTAGFMAPEQAEGKSASARTDIFSLGCVLYFMVVGQPPFTGTSKAAILAALLKDPPAPLPSHDAPGGLNQIIDKSLQKDPTLRYSSMQEVKVALEEVRRGMSDKFTWNEPRPPGGDKNHERRWLARVGRVAVTVIVIAVLWLVISMVRQPVPLVEKTLRLATGTPSGVYNPIGKGLAEVVNEALPNVQIEVLVTDGSLDNIKRLDGGDVQLALVQNDVAFHAVRTDRALGHRSDKIVGVTSLYQEVVQIVVRKTSEIHKIEDLRDKAVNLDPSSGEFSSKILFDHFQVKLDTRKVSNFKTEEAVKRMKDGQLAAMVIWRALPAPFLKDLFASGGFELIPIQGVSGLHLSYPYYTPAMIPARTYPPQNADVPTVGVQAILVAARTVEASVIEDLLRAIFENTQALMAHHPRAKEITLETARVGMPLDLHPGAKAYFSKRKER